MFAILAFAPNGDSYTQLIAGELDDVRREIRRLERLGYSDGKAIPCPLRVEIEDVEITHPAVVRQA